MIRNYQASDEPQWLSTRLLAFFGTNYYDDVKLLKTTLASPSIELVDARATELVGLLDVEIDGEAATIDTIAIRPDHSRSGVGRALLAEALRRLPSSVKYLDAWTREDQAANDWYRAMGFVERYRYLHVYRSDEAGDPRGRIRNPSWPIHADHRDDARANRAGERVARTVQARLRLPPVRVRARPIVVKTAIFISGGNAEPARSPDRPA